MNESLSFKLLSKKAVLLLLIGERQQQTHLNGLKALGLQFVENNDGLAGTVELKQIATVYQAHARALDLERVGVP